MFETSYFRKVITPSINLAMDKFKSISKTSDYFRIIKDGILPGRKLYPEVVYVLTTWCSLKCKECNNLMPHYKEPYHVPVEEVLKDIEELTKHVDTLVNFTLIGGEPFLYPELSKVLDAVIANDKILYVNITSNGTVLPNDEILEKLKNNKLLIVFSDYGVESQKIEKVKEKFTEHGVKYDYKRDLTWVSAGGFENRGKDISQLKKEYQKCFSYKYCTTLLKGRLYSCSRSASLHDLNLMDNEQDYFEIHKSRTNKEFDRELKEFWMRDWAEACNYCDHALRKNVTPGVQAESGKTAPMSEL